MMGQKRGRSKLRMGQLKRFSSTVINTGSGPNKAVVEEYRARIQSMTDGEPCPEPVAPSLEDLIKTDATPLHRIWNPRKAEFENVDPAHPRFRVLSDLRIAKIMWQGPRHQRCRDLSFVVLQHSVYDIIEMYFTVDCYFFVRKESLIGCQQRSIVYSTRDRAMKAFKNNKIIWVETTDLE